MSIAARPTSTSRWRASSTIWTRPIRTEALEYLASLKPKDAEAIRKMLFKFEDSDEAFAKPLTVLMDGVPVERTVIALQGAEPALQTKVLSALSPRARRMAEAEMQSPANVPARDIVDAQACNRRFCSEAFGRRHD